jgi:ubiquinone/menaquinone biosynthesis C-methylase UbiE
MPAIVRRYYDLVARVYDAVWARYVRESGAIVAGAVEMRPGDRILDVGCGTGHVLERLAARSPECRLYGIDLSDKMLDVARRRVGSADLRIADARRLPFERDSMDVVVSASMLQHIRDPGSAVDEIARVCAPDGLVVILFWRARSRRNRIFEMTFGRLDPSFKSLMDVHVLCDRLTTSGFASPRSRDLSIGWWDLSLVTARKTGAG